MYRKYANIMILYRVGERVVPRLRQVLAQSQHSHTVRLGQLRTGISYAA